MNDKIKELHEQAVDSLRHKPFSMSQLNEKFAELIVRECATVQHKRFCEHGDVSWDILMEHFGIKDE